MAEGRYVRSELRKGTEEGWRFAGLDKCILSIGLVQYFEAYRGPH